MLQSIEIPKEVEVLPVLEMPLDIHGFRISSYTCLYRKNANIPTVMDAALLSFDESSRSPLSVLSVGSSYGAEADTVLAYLAARMPDMHGVQLQGVDVSHLAVERARYAKYAAKKHERRSFDELRTALPFFDVTLHEENWEGQTTKEILIGSESLRSRHDVRFSCGDLSSSDLQVDEADVILCNNVLYHLKKNHATRMVDRMVGLLKPGGILSFEIEAPFYAMANEENGTQYDDWRDQTADRLTKNGFTAVLFDNHEMPHAFQKAA